MKTEREWKQVRPKKFATLDENDRLLASVTRTSSGDWHWWIHETFGPGHTQGLQPKKYMAMAQAEKYLRSEQIQRKIETLAMEYRRDNGKRPTYLLLDRDSYQLLKATIIFALEYQYETKGSFYCGYQIAILEGIQTETIKMAG